MQEWMTFAEKAVRQHRAIEELREYCRTVEANDGPAGMMAESVGNQLDEILGDRRVGSNPRPEESDEAWRLLRAITNDAGDCRIDHNGACQEHLWFYDGCPYGTARDLIAKVDAP